MCSTAQHGLAQRSTTRHSLAQHSTTQLSIAQLILPVPISLLTPPISASVDHTYFITSHFISTHPFSSFFSSLRLSSSPSISYSTSFFFTYHPYPYLHTITHQYLLLTTPHPHLHTTPHFLPTPHLLTTLHLHSPPLHILHSITFSTSMTIRLPGRRRDQEGHGSRHIRSRSQ